MLAYVRMKTQGWCPLRARLTLVEQQFLLRDLFRFKAAPLPPRTIVFVIFGADASAAGALKRLVPLPASVIALLEVALRLRPEAPAHQCLWDPHVVLFRYIFPQLGPYRSYAFQEESRPTFSQEHQIRLALAA